MTLYQFLQDQASRTSDAAIPFGLLYAAVSTIKRYTPVVTNWLRTAKTTVTLTRPNGSSVDVSIDPQSGAADFHVIPATPKETTKP